MSLYNKIKKTKPKSPLSSFTFGLLGVPTPILPFESGIKTLRKS